LAMGIPLIAKMRMNFVLGSCRFNTLGIAIVIFHNVSFLYVARGNVRAT
jgi:hypothetical protein